MSPSLQARIYANLDKSPQRRAIAFCDDSGAFTWSTNEVFYSRALDCASRLTECGLGKGDVCLIVLYSGEFAGTLITATLLVGALPLLVAPPVLLGPHSNLRQVLDHVIGKTNPRVVVCSESLADMREELEKGKQNTRFLFGEDELAALGTSNFELAAPSEDEVAAMQLTSGTTGFPRVCVWKQRSVLAALDGMRDAMKLSEEDVCLNWTPLYHDMGLVNNFLLCLTSGIPLVMLSPLDFVNNPALWIRGLHESGATVTWSPNFGFAYAAQRVKDSDIQGVRLDGVRGFWNAAERIHLETMRKFHERFSGYGVSLESLKTNFGCAENIGGATFSDPDGLFKYERLDVARLQADRIAEPVAESDGGQKTIVVVGAGRPHSGMEMRILSETEEVLPDGHVGEIALLTSSRMEGYLDDKEATDEAIRGDYLLTGDLGYMRDGELFWVGRSRERIAVMGRKLDPSDFEPVLLEISGLREGCFAAFGVDDREKGTENVVIVSEVRDSASRKPEEITGEIRSQAFLRLGVHVNDVVLVHKGTLTKTSSGKRRHSHFRELYLNGQLQEFRV